MDEPIIYSYRKRKSGRKKVLKPCACGNCRRCRTSATLKLLYASGQRNRGWHGADWSPDELQVLRDWIGLISYEELAERLLRTGAGRERTPKAMKQKAYDLGLSVRKRHYTLSSLEPLFGINDRTVRQWIANGYLREQPWNGQRGSPRQIARAELERFIRTYPWLLDPSRITERRLQALAQIQDQYLTVKEVARALHISDSYVFDLIRDGILPAQRYTARQWVVRAKDIPDARERLEQRRSSAIMRRAATWKERYGKKAG